MPVLNTPPSFACPPDEFVNIALDFLACDQPEFLVDALPAAKREYARKMIEIVNRGARQSVALAEVKPAMKLRFYQQHNAAARELMREMAINCGLVICKICRKWFLPVLGEADHCQVCAEKIREAEAEKLRKYGTSPFDRMPIRHG